MKQAKDPKVLSLSWNNARNNGGHNFYADKNAYVQVRTEEVIKENREHENRRSYQMLNDDRDNSPFSKCSINNRTRSVKKCWP